MKRMHLFEFMDLKWYPSILRNLQTNILQVIMTRSPAFDPAIPHIDRLLQRTGQDRIIDLCSGASGPWPRISKKLTSDDVKILLTDKYPNAAMFAELEVRSDGLMTGVTRSVDARAVPEDIAGIRTIFTAFHHFREREVETILSDAQTKGQALCVFDYVPNKVLALAFSPFAFIVSILQFYFLSFAVRPFSWKQLVFTNLIPIVPIVSAWDGFVSSMRKYDVETLKRIVRGRDTPTYTWEVGTDASYSRATAMTYLLGTPLSRES